MLLQQKLLIVESLEKETGEKVLKNSAIFKRYRPVKNDLIDELIGRVLNDL
jgi:hypothetical protein